MAKNIKALKKIPFKYIYGPVSSWRLGRSLGIDLLGSGKICNFDCVYCQIGKTKKYRTKRGRFIPLKALEKELKRVPRRGIDMITFSGLGEGTLSKDLAKAIKLVRKLRSEPICVLTNATLMYRKDVRRELSLVDLVAAKLDASDKKTLRYINRPAPSVSFKKIFRGIKQFAKRNPGRLALQIMFVKENKSKAKELARLAREINPLQVELNTPLRPCAVKPLSKKEMNKIKKIFHGLPIVSVYDVKPKKAIPISTTETLRRRGKPY